MLASSAFPSVPELVLRSSIITVECSGCDWNPQKNLENYRKHEIWVEDASCIFDDPNLREEVDDRDYDEERWIATGRVGINLLVVVYTERHGSYWIISARKAEPSEEIAFYDRSRYR